MLFELATYQSCLLLLNPLPAVVWAIQFDEFSDVPSNSSSKVQVHRVPLALYSVGPAQVGDGDGAGGTPPPRRASAALGTATMAATRAARTSPRARDMATAFVSQPARPPQGAPVKPRQ